MNILVITNNYPSLQNPNYGAFVYNLMQELAIQNEITIISPMKLHSKIKPKHETYGKELCLIKRPNYLSLGARSFAFLKLSKLSRYLYGKAIHRVLKKNKKTPDVLYVHFIVNAIPVLDYATKYNLPIVVASGESTYKTFESLEYSLKIRLIESITRVICVSKENKEQLINLGFDSDKLVVIANAVNYDLFKPIDKIKCRQKNGLPIDKFIVGFIGHFVERKGPNRIIKAIENLKDKDLHLVCVGNRGELIPNNYTTVREPVANAFLPEIYNSFDLFVLPTLHEGSCNVIEEAKACCLPIISSKGTSVEEQIVHKKTGILIDPLNIHDIGQSIKELKDNNDLRLEIINNLNFLVGSNSLSIRAEKINNLLKKIV